MSISHVLSTFSLYCIKLTSLDLVYWENTEVKTKHLHIEEAKNVSHGISESHDIET